MQYDNTIVVNLIAGPCAGKSTVASGLFYNLKMRGIDCEIALEYAKDAVWNEAYTTLKDQIYVFGKEYHKIWRLNNKVQVIITDSPILLSIYYKNFESDYFENFVIEQFNRFNNITYFLDRATEYNPNGRIHTEEQALHIDQVMKDLLDKHNIQYQIIRNTEACDIITQQILEKIK